MNSWLGGGLSSLKGQLSHLINEGTEEISDPSMEIFVAKKKISELESELKSAINETNDLKCKNNDLRVKLQSEELLLDNVSQSYQEKLKQKEEMIETLTNELSNVKQEYRDNEGPVKSGHDEGFLSEFYGNAGPLVNHGPSNDVAALHQTIVELNQQLAKYRSLCDGNESGTSSDQCHSFEATVAGLLEEQQRELEMRHSSYVLELQQEHSCQLAYLNRKLQLYDQQYSRNDEDEQLQAQHEEVQDREMDDTQHHSRDCADTVDNANIKKSFAHVAVETCNDDLVDLSDGQTVWCNYDSQVTATKDQIGSLLDLITDKIIRKEATLEMIIAKILRCEMEQQSGDSSTKLPGHYSGALDNVVHQFCTDIDADNQISMRLAAHVKNVIADSMSQVSDISEVSIKSRILDEHVRNLSNQIGNYEQHIVNIDNGTVGATEAPVDVDKINCKIEDLKEKLSQRKYATSEHENILECPADAVDSWENSSVNSLVEESAELQQDGKPDVSIEGPVRELYRIMCVDSSDNGLNINEMLQVVTVAISEMMEKIEMYKHIENEISALYSDLNNGNEGEQSSDVFMVIESLKENMKVMKETCSVHDYIIEENKSLQELASQLRSKLSNLEKEKCDLITKNSELDEQLIDMSITIARYEGLEKICDRYQKEMAIYKPTVKINVSMDSDDILEHVETFNQEKDECIQSLESKIVSLQNLCEEKDDFISDLKQREMNIVFEYESMITVLNGELDSLRIDLEKMRESELTYKKQIQELQTELIEKEIMIKSLNEELTMLSVIDIENDLVVDTKKECQDDFSQTHDGVERALIMAMEEKIGLLATENQRLEKVLEAQASSLGQYEIKVNSLELEMSKLSQRSSIDHESLSAEDMTKETLHHLSQMIRDKEWEIEALKSKNDSIISIIKNYNQDDAGSPNIDYIESVLSEKENLSKELSWYQENRDQLIAALNLKHKESLNYHGEIQRLIAYINTEQAKWNEFVVENEQMKEQLKILLMEKASVIAQVETLTKPKVQMIDAAVSFAGSKPSFEEEFVVDIETEQCKLLKDRCSELEDEKRQNLYEIRNLQKQVEQTSFELEQSHLQIVELTNSLTRSQQQLEYCQNELACQYRNTTPSRPVDSTKDIWNTEYDDESIRPEIVVVDDKEQLQQQLYQKSIECDNYANQIEQLKAREQKLLKEKQIFQDHLIRIEESYTHDATLAEDREQALRRQLHVTEDNLQTAQSEISKLQKIVSNIRNELQNELNATKFERDEALEQLRETELQLAESSTSLDNLQLVLDNFQQEQSVEMAYQKERLQQDLRKITEERDRWEVQYNDLREEMEAQKDLVDAAQRLADQMELKDDQLAEIQALLAKKEEYIDHLKMEIRKLNTFTESKVDKVLMRNLVIGYFHTPQHRRQEALKVIGSLLQFADTDYSQIGVDTANKSRWFNWLRPGSTDKTSLGLDSELTGKSFSELFITFLEKESSPMPQMKLPTNQIAAEARQHSSLSQSEEYPYTHSASLSSVIDHHKFFSSSPIVTKRNGSSNADQPPNNPDATGPKDTPLLYIPDIDNINADITQKDHKSMWNHRRSESNRNALLSFLDQ